MHKGGLQASITFNIQTLHKGKPNTRNREFVSHAISELEQNRCIVKVSKQPYVCSPLSVVSNCMGKQRLVINLCYLNGFLWKEKFKYEDIRIAMLLKSGYCHVDIFESHRQFLETRGHKTILHVHSPAFWVGHSLLCFHYKLLRPLVKYWQSSRDSLDSSMSNSTSESR